MRSDVCFELTNNISSDLQTGIKTYAGGDSLPCYPPVVARLRDPCEAALASREAADIETLIRLIREVHAVRLELDCPPSET